MASRRAKEWLRSIGTPVIHKPHTALELSNFAAGSGSGKFAMPYHIIRMARETGDSKMTVGYADTLKNARDKARAMMDANGIESARARFTYYIRDIRNGAIYRA